MKTKRRLLLFLPVALAIGWLAFYGTPPVKHSRSPFTVGKATTVVTGPVDGEGYIDYATALNERLSQHIKPDDNANVLLWQAFGPHPEGTTMPPGYFHWLGMEQPPEHGEYWIPMDRFLKKHPNLKPRPRQGQNGSMESVDQQFDQTMRRPWKATEYPWIATWLKINDKPLTLIVQATQRSQYYNPLVPSKQEGASGGLISVLLPNVQFCRGVATALICRAMLALKEGRSADAWHDLLACHRLGRLVGRGGTLIEYLVGVAIDTMAGEADLAFLARSRLNPKQIRQNLRDLQQLPAFSELANKIDLAERFMILDIAMRSRRGGAIYLAGIATGGPGVDPSVLQRVEQFIQQLRLNRVNWDATLRGINKWYDRLAAASRAGDRPTREKQLDVLINDLRDTRAAVREHPIASIFFPNRTDGTWMSDMLVSLLMPATAKIQAASDRMEQTHTNRYLAFALAAYRQDHGRYPARLSALTPKYLDRVPLDLFSGKPLIYRPTTDGYLLYSVGINGKDEQGRGNDVDPAGDDLSVRMPLPAPPVGD